MNARRFLARARIVIYVAITAVVVVHVLRYDIISLPEAGCSPLRAFAPGDRLLVDRWEDEFELQTSVLFRAPDGELLLGAVGVVPPSAPADMHAEVALGALWILTDAADCPGRDSRALGPIAKVHVEGSIRLRLPW